MGSHDAFFICSICCKVFSNQLKYTAHTEKHQARPFDCKICRKNFVTLPALDSHNALMHKPKTTFKCEFCSYAVTEKRNLTRHTISVHTKDYPYRCNICNCGFFQKSDLQHHQNIKHDDKLLVCPFCSKRFTCRVWFKEHVRKHDPIYIDEVYKCEFCTKFFGSKSSLQKHVVTHTERCDGVCDICGKEVLKKTLNHHKRIHQRERESLERSETGK